MSTIVITGASSGIGAVAAARLAEEGWTVAVVGRNAERTNQVAASIGGNAFIADFDRLDDVRALAGALTRRYPSIEVLANNAGGLVRRRGRSADGYERTIQHNHLAPFLLTNLLLPTLQSSAALVINTASVANRAGRLRIDDLDFDARAYGGGWRPYGTAKLANILFTRELAKRTGITAYSFHPGFVSSSFAGDTPFGRLAMALSRSAQISVDAGAAPLVRLATDLELDVPNGTYFDRFEPGGRRSELADDAVLAEQLWDISAKLVGLSPASPAGGVPSMPA